ncbi:serine protease Do [Kushneria indalinina DSM 14324]|uniref:Probable periplasmic serine endoprotease DegP-like n=2 Tax=Kushneria indalinina TaxID=184067 RepID=A0A3D9DZ90_9GAMM|nr:serine protease Do [Kushneria indalinina DSM 14324]
MADLSFNDASVTVPSIGRLAASRWQAMVLLMLLMTALMVMSLPARAVEQKNGLPDFTALVKSAAPAVVNISTTREAAARSGMMGPNQQLPDIFRHFFGDQMPPGFGGMPDQRGGRTLSSLGSGFIISDDGYILTNAHVIDGADTVTVRLNDRRELTADVIGQDQKTDIALIKVDANDLPTLRMGDSDGLETGEWVAAIGSPFGFDHSVTAGIVSAINRTLPTDSYVPFIQTDVAINPGNSGGPLFNLDGEVVGINSQIFTRSGGFMGVSFAIPINVAMDIADQLKDNGRVDRGWLGVVIQPVSEDLADSFGLDRARGALIAEVAPDSPAEKSGLRSGDIILRAGDSDIDTSDALPRLIGRVSPDDSIDLHVQRDGREQTIKVTVGQWPDSDSDTGEVSRADSDSIGLAVSGLSAEQRQQLGIEAGVLVQQVAQDSPAARAGLQPGDVVVELAGQPVDSVATLRKLVGQLDDKKAVPMRINRDGATLFVPLRLSTR